MNFKKNWKRFCDLSSAREGFTLVELIVVIAILAILAGIAVPAYSGYVTKANKQADITLISEIEHALTLAAYSGNLPYGYVVVSTTGVRTSGEEVDTAMAAAFGEGWQNVAVLKYDEWNSSNVYADISLETLDAVVSSSYMNGLRRDKLLTDVEKMTQMAQELVFALSGDENLSAGSISSLFEGKLDETATEYGITLAPGETWESWGATNKEAYGNLLVLTAADEFKNYKENGEELSFASEIILQFSAYYGFAAQNEDFSQEFDVFMDDLQNIENIEDGKDWLNELKAAANANGFQSNYDAGQQETDENAFVAILAALGGPTAEQKDSIVADIDNTNLFTDGVVNNMFNDYMDTVDVVLALAMDENFDAAEIGLQPGEVLVLLNAANGVIRVSNSLPEA